MIGYKSMTLFLNLKKKIKCKEIIFNVKTLGSIKVSLIDNCKSVRTKLCSTACSLVATLVSNFPRDFGSHAEFFINNLLEIVIVTVKARVSAVDNTITTIVEYISPKQTINPIINGVMDQNITLRGKCIRYLKTIVDIHHKDKVEPIIQNIMGILPQTLTDSVQEVRSFSRDILTYVEDNFPEHAKELLINATTNEQLFITKYDTKQNTEEEKPKVNVVKLNSPRTSLGGTLKRVQTLSPNRGENGPRKRLSYGGDDEFDLQPSLTKKTSLRGRGINGYNTITVNTKQRKSLPFNDYSEKESKDDSQLPPKRTLIKSKTARTPITKKIKEEDEYGDIKEIKEIKEKPMKLSFKKSSSQSKINIETLVTFDPEITARRLERLYKRTERSIGFNTHI